MNPHAVEENIRTLATTLGLNHGEAAALLDTTVVITAPANTAALQFARFLQILLERTITTVLVNPSVQCSPAVEVIVASGSTTTSGAPLWVSLSDREVLIGTSQRQSEDHGNPHPIMLLLGACYAAARTLKAIAGERLSFPHSDPLVINADELFGVDFDFSSSLALRATYLAGAGAIGNGFLLALSLLNAEGELHISDPDVVDDRNLNRCVWFTSEDVGKNKAHRLTELAQPSFPALNLIPHDVVLKDVSAAKKSARWLERLIVAVDSRRVRRSLQGEIPREVFDASTTDIREIVLHFNQQPLNGLACMSCVYVHNVDEAAHEKHVAELLGVTLEEVRENYVSRSAAEKICGRYQQFNAADLEGAAYDSLFKQLCGEGVLQGTEDRNVLAPFSFVSVLAGVYLAAELLRRLSRRNAAEPFNYWRLSPWFNPIIGLRKMREFNPQCEVCGNPVLKRVTAEFWTPINESR
jgi:hypothetical protein